MAGEASWAITLPNQFEAFGNIMQRGVNAQNEQNQMLYSETMRDRQQAQNNERYNINLIQEEAKARELATGNTTFDNWLGSEYDKSLKEIMTMPLSTMPPAELFAKVKAKFSPLTQTAMRLKNTIDAIDENTKAVGSEMTDIDAAGLAARAKEAAINDLMPVDKSTGLRNYMPQNFKPDKDYVSDIMSSPNSWELIKDGSKFTDFIKNYKTSPISVHKQFADKSLQGYTGRKSPFKRLNVTPDENSRIKASEDPKLEVDTMVDFIQDGNLSKSINILADEPYQLIQSNDQAARGLTHLWEKYKKENNLSYNNPEENEKRKRKFAVDLIETADVSEIIGQTPTHLPRTNNYINSKPSKSEVIANTPIRLDEYEKVGNEYDVTPLAPGIKVTGFPTGETLAAKQILFNPDTKKITYTDQAGDKKQVDFETFRQNIATINTGVDLSFIDRLKVTGRPGSTKPPVKTKIKTPEDY